VRPRRRFHAEHLPAAPGWHERADRCWRTAVRWRGYWADEQCELVHRRLALIDLSPPVAQPLTNETGDVWVVFNGEIYQSRALRALLAARGTASARAADTEVLVHLYGSAATNSSSTPRHFRICRCTTRGGAASSSPDRFGVKPLFYAIRGEQIVFASEIKAITALPAFRPTLDASVLRFPGLGYSRAATGFQRDSGAPPGDGYSWRRPGRTHTQRYASVAPDPTPCAAWTTPLHKLGRK